jgi:two-component system sensor histidine kinase PilS (NtrC family)
VRPADPPGDARPAAAPVPSAPLPGAASEGTGTYPGVPQSAEERRRSEDRRTVSYLMLFRLVLATVLMLGAVSLAWSLEAPESLGRSFGWFTFGLLGATYLATLIYAVVLRQVANLVRFAFVQIAVDLLLIAVLVHATGGAHSAFTFLFMLEVVAVSLLPQRYGAAYVALASAGLVLLVCLLGYGKVVPLVPGQLALPWEMSFTDLLFRLIVNLAALGATAALGLTLSGQTRRVGERLARHQQYAGDLASLHQNTIRCLSSGLVTVTLEGHITSINEAACDILGLPVEAAMGRPVGAFMSGLKPVLAELGPVGSVRRIEVNAVRPDGALRRLGVSATPLTDHQGQAVGRVIHFQDLTELRRMELRVARAERLASIGRLAAAIAHEIRNPLASISGSVEILRSLPGADAEARQLVDIAVREVDRLNALITDLLDYARPKTQERAPIDLAESVAEVAKSFQQERREGITIETSLEKGVGVQGAPGPLRQVLWNLVRNAAEAMPRGGRVRLVVALDRGEGGAPEAILTVADTGVGMSREALEHIFEPFFSTKSGGTGLGLATVARVVEEHGGSIDTQSELGQGTTFTVRFPAIPIPERTPTAVRTLTAG